MRQRASSSLCVPLSTMQPPSMTKMQSALMAEVMRCVTTICVRPAMRRFRAVRRFFSVRKSSAEKLSSKM